MITRIKRWFMPPVRVVARQDDKGTYIKIAGFSASEAIKVLDLLGYAWDDDHSRPPKTPATSNGCGMKGE